jgi:hypothetical protein
MTQFEVSLSHIIRNNYRNNPTSRYQFYCLIFHQCDKRPEIINFNEEKLILAHGFGGFSPWSVDLKTFGPVVRQNIVVGAYNRGNLFTS